MSLRTVHTVANLGAGTMGHATALQFAMHGCIVNLLDTDPTALSRGMTAIQRDLTTFHDAGLLTETPAAILTRIHPTTDNATALTAADFVIESIAEDLALKKSVWQTVEQLVQPDVLLATNTSGLSPTTIQKVLQRPERFVVAHFWNPAQLMPLVEVVPGELTAQATVTATVALMTKIGKHAVALQKESLGFVGNRIQLAVLREALHVVAEGIATPEAVDDIITYSLGRRWNLVGPIASADLGGLDVFKNISAYLYADLANETTTDPALSQKVAENHLGLKSGQGFYNWTGETGRQVIAQRDRRLLDQLKNDQSH